ncbi:MAG: IS1182 family transposase [Acidobacteriia bacterium]|nr:IS1182 family transposase [Terriglobia bacterium]
MENESPTMEGTGQVVLLPEVQLWPRAESENTEDKPPVRVKAVQRDQLVMRPLEVEQLLGPEHPARAIWELVGQRDLRPFHKDIKAVEGKAGRPPHDPRLLISVWVYSYMQGIASGREIERRCAYDPAYMWLTGAEKVCAHTLTDYRATQGEPLKDLFIQVLAVMEKEGLVDLQQVTQDGTKISASAGADTFRRKKTVAEHLERARKRVKELSQGDEGENEARSQQALAAQKRGAQEKLERMEKALKEIEALEKKADDPEKVRVSTTDPDARVMKQSNNGYGPSYNAQFTTDAKKIVIVSVEVTQDSNDAGQLQPAMQRVEEEAGRAPQQVIADGSYTNRSNIVEMEQSHIDLIGPVPDGTAQKETLYQIRGVAQEFRPEAFALDAAKNCYTCPAGKSLPYKKKQVLPGQTKYTYQAAKADCQGCVHKPRCCAQSKNGRSLVRAEDSTEVKKFRAKMETEAAKEIYKKRGAVAEFPHLCIKERFGLRRFSLRGLTKVNLEGMWLALTFNVQQWIRLCWQPRQLQGV